MGRQGCLNDRGGRFIYHEVDEGRDGMGRLFWDDIKPADQFTQASWKE